LVSLNSNMNKMDTNNLSIIFGSMSGIFVTSNDSSSSELIEFLVDNYSKIYEDNIISNQPKFIRRLVCERSILSFFKV